MSSVEFALRSGEIVEIKSHELPPNGEEICNALKIEGVNLEVYGSIANLYKSTGNISECISVLQKAVEDSELRNASSFIKNYNVLKSALALNSINYKVTEEYLNEATLSINSLERFMSISSSELSSQQGNILKALIYFYRGLFDLCEAQLKSLSTVETRSESFLFFLLSGIVKMKTNDFVEGLKKLAKSFKVYPWSTTMILIGDCWNQLGFPEKALESLQVAIELENKHEMRLLIASKVVHLCSKIPNKKYLFETFTLYLEKINNIDEMNVYSLCHLADHFFYRKDFDKCRYLINYALKNETNLTPSLLAYIHYIHAKLSHSANNYEDAFVSYMTSLRHKSDFPPSIVGLAKIYTLRKDVNSALNFMEKLSPNTSDSSHQRLIFLLYIQKYLDSKNPKYLKLAKTAALNINDFERIHLYQQLAFPNTDFREKLDGNSHSTLNRAVLGFVFDGHPFQVLDNYEVYEDVFKFNSMVTDRSLPVDDQLLPNNSNYALFLGYRYLHEGELSKATDIAKDYVGNHEDDPHGWFLMAECQYAQKAHVPCRKTLERILQKINKHNEVALVKLGTLYIDFARSSKKTGDVKTTRVYYKRSMEFFAKALTINSFNSYASLGVAVVLTENGDYISAKEIFDSVRGIEALKPELEIEACLGSANCLLNSTPHNDTAIFSCLAQATKRFESNLQLKNIFKQKVELLLSKAYFLCGLALSQTKYVQKSLELLNEFDKTYLDKATLELNEAVVNVGMCGVVLQHESQHTFSIVESCLIQIQLTIDVLESVKEHKFRREYLVPKYLKEANRLKQELTMIHSKLATDNKVKLNYMEEIQKQRERVLKQQQEDQERLEHSKKQQAEEIERQRKVLAEKLKDMRFVSKVDIVSEEDGENEEDVGESSKKRKGAGIKSPRKKKGSGAAILSDDFVFSDDDKDREGSLVEQDSNEVEPNDEEKIAEN